MTNQLTYLDFNEAVDKSLELVTNTTLTEIVSLWDALNRVLSKEIVCIKNLPAFNNSAMDGFAVKFEDAGKTLTINKTIFAGDCGEAVKESLNSDECYKIMTGAKVPFDADTIIPIEHCFDVTNTSVRVPENIKKGSNLRLKGEEQQQGNVMFKAGEVLNSSHIILLASQGIMTVEVYKKLSIIIVSTGNELKEPWQISNDEEIYNCNSFGLIALLKQIGFDASYGGVIPDNLESSVSFIKSLKKYDVIITTGGISMGEADFVGEAFLKNGLEVIFHGVNVKPGRPIMMGSLDKTVVMCLPGNPLTAMINMHLFALPVLNKLQGSEYIYHDVVKATNTKEFKTKAGRVNLVLGNLIEGDFTVTRNNKYGSGMITALYESNSILVTDNNTSSIDTQQEVFVVKFDNKLIKNRINIFN
jgi:molybdopterin molybdotransferase